jgi:hypothetical protein
MKQTPPGFWNAIMVSKTECGDLAEILDGNPFLYHFVQSGIPLSIKKEKDLEWRSWQWTGIVSTDIPFFETAYDTASEARCPATLHEICLECVATRTAEAGDEGSCLGSGGNLKAA